MDPSRERNQSIERLLRQSLQTSRHAGVTESCLDAEVLAAWVDGGLSGAALEMAQSHVADCARCQSLIGALARTNAAVPLPAPVRAVRRWLPWLVPLTAAAAVVTVWVAVSRETSAPVGPAPPAADVQTQTADAKAQESRARDDQPRTPAVSRETRRTQAAASKAEGEAPVPELRNETSPLRTDSAPQERSVSPSAAPRQGVAGGRLAESVTVTGESPTIEIVSPDPSARWRISGSVLEHSTDGGSSWDPTPTSIEGQLTAGSAPSASVCWVVGRGGVVLLSIDGRTWRRLAFPEITDLSSVRAADARMATVSTADGRIFSTSDGGVTWDRR